MFENPRRGSQARNFTLTNVPKILDLKLSSEQIFSKNWRWVPLVRDCEEYLFTRTLIKADFASRKGRASPTSTNEGQYLRLGLCRMNFFAWFSCLFFFFWPSVGHAPKLCVFMSANRNKSVKETIIHEETIGTVLKTPKTQQNYK